MWEHTEEREECWGCGHAAGVGERESPEDRSYLLLLAAAPQRAQQHLKQRGDLKLLTETVATDLGSQTPAPFLWVRNLSGPPRCWLLKATCCWMQERVRRSMTQLDMVSCGLVPRLLQSDVRATSTFMRPYVRVHIRG